MRDDPERLRDILKAIDQILTKTQDAPGIVANHHECGTWIVRDGMSREVHRDSRGFTLEPGDDIHFGGARPMALKWTACKW